MVGIQIPNSPLDTVAPLLVVKGLFGGGIRIPNSPLDTVAPLLVVKGQFDGWNSNTK